MPADLDAWPMWINDTFLVVLRRDWPCCKCKAPTRAGYRKKKGDQFVGRTWPACIACAAPD